MAILECKDLTKYYDRTLGLDHLSLQLEPGRIVGLLGPNGAGKTTLLKIANGLLTPSSGQLLIDGKAPGPDTRRLVSYLPERTYLSDWMTVVQLLDFFCDFYPDFRPGGGGAYADGSGDQSHPAHQADVQGYTGKGAADPGHEPPHTAVSAGRAHRRRGSRHQRLHHPHHPHQLQPRTPLCSSPPTSSPTWSGFWTTWCSSAEGQLVLHQSVDQIRQERGCSVDDLFREVFRYAE